MTTTLLKCRFCGLETTKNGQPFKNHSALNTHINMHCPKKTETNIELASKDCVHVYQLLNSNSVLLNSNSINEIVQQIIAKGYTKCCKKCGDLQ